MLAKMRESGVECGSAVLVMSGELSQLVSADGSSSPVSTLMPTLCDNPCNLNSTCSPQCYFLRCYTRDQVWSRKSAEVFDGLLQRAMADFVIAQAASAFFGNLYSTMSNELLFRHRAAGHVAEFYNPPT